MTTADKSVCRACGYNVISQNEKGKHVRCGVCRNLGQAWNSWTSRQNTFAIMQTKNALDTETPDKS